MIEKDIGFVLRRYNFRESSIIATLFTWRFGKITGIFKGFYPYRKEFTSSLDIFSLNEFIFYPKKSQLWLVSFADLIYDYPFLRDNISKAKLAATFFRLIDRTFGLWESNPSVFQFLKDTLYWLHSEDETKVFLVFLIKFLTLSGFKPEFNRCLSCKSLLEEDIFFSASGGGLVCSDCSSGVSDAEMISKDTTSSFRYIQNNDIPLVWRLSLTVHCQRQMHYILQRFLLYHVDFDIGGVVSRFSRVRNLTSQV